MLYFEPATYFTFFSYKSETICQLDSNKVSNSKLKPDLGTCVETRRYSCSLSTVVTQTRNDFFAHPVKVFFLQSDLQTKKLLQI